MNADSNSPNISFVCQSCGSKGIKWSVRYPNLRLYSCSECQSLSYMPPNAFDQKAFYTQEYFSGGEYMDYVGHRNVHEANAKNKWKMLKPYLQTPTLLLEIGCAYGFFVNYVIGNGAKQAYGTDVCVDAIEYATNNFGPYFVNSSDPDVLDLQFNCLVAWDVWEHLIDPIQYFSKYISLLAPGGVFAIGTIDSSSVVATIRGARWRQIHPPTHIHYPTKKGIANCMTSLGLEILHHSHIGHYRALESYLGVFGLDKLGRGGRLVERAMKYPIPLDLKDEQVIICRKPENY